MRTPMLKRLRAGAPHVRYGDARARIETGDVLLFAPNRPLSRLLSWVSGSPYSHAGLAAWWGDRLFVLHATPRGVLLEPASLAIDAFDGRVDWLTIRPECKTELDRELLLDAAQEELMKPQPRSSLFLLTLRTLLGYYRSARCRHRLSALVSSDYVARCYQNAGLNLSPDAGGQCMSPGDLARSKVLVLCGVLHAGHEGAPIAEPVSITPRDVAL